MRTAPLNAMLQACQPEPWLLLQLLLALLAHPQLQVVMCGAALICSLLRTLLLLLGAAAAVAGPTGFTGRKRA